MASLISSLISGKATVPQVPEDDVYPMHFFDDNPLFRKYVIAWMFQFNDVLDAQKLQVAVGELLEIPSWRYLGGRLRMKPSGKLEIHVPKEFTAHRPSFRFSQTTFEERIEAHALGSKLPKRTASPSLHASPMDFMELGAHPNAPRVLDDFLHVDEPQLSLHITSFANATLFSLAFPHTLSDAMGMSTFMSGLSLTLAGRKSEVPDLPLPTHDILAEVGQLSPPSTTPKPEPYILAPKQLTGLRGILFGLNYARDMLWNPQIELRTIYFPASFMQQLRSTAEAELDTIRANAGPDDIIPPFLSDGDILSSWCTNMILHNAGAVPAIILNIFSARNRLPCTTGGSYIQNMIFNTYALLSSQQVGSISLGSVAVKLRTSLMQQTTEEQVHAIVRESRGSHPVTGGIPLFGERNSRLVIVDNWDKAKMFDAVDFSAAVVKQKGGTDGKIQESGRVGKLVYHHAHMLVEGQLLRDFVNIIGKDLDGGFFFNAMLRPETWLKIEEVIAESESRGQ